MASQELFSWKRLCYALLLLLSVQAVLLFRAFEATTTPTFVTDLRLSESVLTSHTSSGGSSNSHDRYADSLTAEQCLTTFPNLYHEIDRATAYWKESQRNVSADDLDISWQPQGMFDGGAMRILIHNNRLRILESRNALVDRDYSERGLGIINLVQNALQSATAGRQMLPTIEAAIVLQDLSFPPENGTGTETFWTWTRGLANRTQDRLWLVPNFDFWATSAAGSFIDNQDLAMQRDNTPKIPKAVWRGTISAMARGNILRQGLVDATEGKTWADAKNTFNANNEKNRLPVDDFCKYLMTIHTEGVSYSGRLKWLLNCNSLPIIHELQWTTHYYHLLQSEGPDQNYIAVKRDWSDLESKVTYYLAHPEETKRIIGNHLATFREHYLTKAAISCYLRRLIDQYATISFTPEVTLTTPDGHKALRGRSFEEYIVKPEDFR